MRDRIVSGMRWTVWLSAISLPFSYATTILLARISPEAIATYGLLMVYIGVVLGLFYLGGDAVAIKFIPELKPENRSSFLISYYGVVCLATIPWIAAALLWPGSLRYLFGNQTSSSFHLFLIIISPLCVLSSVVGAALKGSLEITWAQIVLRLITIGSFLVYITMYFAARPFLASNYMIIIWGTYLGLSTIAVAVGLFQLFVRARNRIEWRKPRFFLPRGFWRYTLSLQQLSALGFFTQRLDALLVLNFGNLALLGQYVALLTLAESIRLIGRYFIDALLPSLTNMIAGQNLTAASDVFATHVRILFLVNTGTTCGLIFFAHAITSLLGHRYAGLSPLVALLAFFLGLATPGGVAGALLSSIGKQQRGVWVAVGQVGLYVGLFLVLWPRWQLTGAVLAYGFSWFISNLTLLIVAKRSSPFHIKIAREYSVFTCIAAAAVFVELTRQPGLLGAFVGLAAAMSLFVLLGNYTAEECQAIVRFFVPSSGALRARLIGSEVKQG